LAIAFERFRRAAAIQNAARCGAARDRLRPLLALEIVARRTEIIVECRLRLLLRLWRRAISAKQRRFLALDTLLRADSRGASGQICFCERASSKVVEAGQISRFRLAAAEEGTDAPDESANDVAHSARSST